MGKDLTAERNRDEDLADLSAWIDEALQQQATRLVLEQRSDGGLVREWKIAGNGNGEGLKMSEQILARAEREGKTQAAVRVGFVVLAYRTEDIAAKHIDRHSFFVPGGNARQKSGSGELDDLSGGGPIDRIFSEMRRMVVDMHRIALAGRETENEFTQRILQRLVDENDKLRTERVRIWEVAEKLHDQEDERAVRRQQLKQSEKRDELLYENFGMLFPIAMNRLLGGGPGKGRPPMGEELLMKLLGSFKPEQIEGMASQLSPEQAALFAEIYTAYQARHEAREKQRKQLNGMATEPAKPDGKESPS